MFVIRRTWFLGAEATCCWEWNLCTSKLWRRCSVSSEANATGANEAFEIASTSAWGDAAWRQPHRDGTASGASCANGPRVWCCWRCVCERERERFVMVVVLVLLVCIFIVAPFPPPYFKSVGNPIFFIDLLFKFPSFWLKSLFEHAGEIAVCKPTGYRFALLLRPPKSRFGS